MKLHSNGLTYYALQGMNCKIEKYDGTDTSVAIPQILDGYTVKKIDHLAFYLGHLWFIIRPKLNFPTSYMCSAYSYSICRVHQSKSYPVTVLFS